MTDLNLLKENCDVDECDRELLVAEIKRLRELKTSASPTQAQIEAAAKAIHALELEHGYVTREWRGIDAETEYAAMAKAALSEVDKIGKDTATAQVGETTMDEKLEQWDKWYETLPPALKAKLSISDFRRLGDNFYRIFVLQKPVAASRKLKDAP